MIGPTPKRLTLPGAFMVFGVLCAVATMFAHGALAQEEKVKKFQMSVNEVLQNDELNQLAARVRDMLKLIASDSEVAGAILRAASANRAGRSPALDEANLLIKKKLPPARVKATQEVKISDVYPSDVYPEGQNLYIEICWTTEKGKTCITIEIRVKEIKETR